MSNSDVNKRELTCIICPRGCRLSVEISEEVSVFGNLCPRGKAYAVTECTDPRRTVTSTVRTSDGGLVSVRTSVPIPKDKVMECMKIINSIVAPIPISIGDTLATDAFGADIVATQNRK